MADPTPVTDRIQRQLDRYRAGDPEALDALFEESYQRIRVLARGMLRANRDLKARHETDDILHRALLTLLKALPENRPETAGGFVYGLAGQHIRWVLLDLVEAYKAGELKQDATLDRFESPDAGPQDVAAWGDFHEAVGRLPARYRDVYHLHYYQGLDQATAAGLLGISLRQFSREWQDAQVRLSELLYGRGPRG